jgi:hypothetical protein
MAVSISLYQVGSPVFWNQSYVVLFPSVACSSGFYVLVLSALLIRSRQCAVIPFLRTVVLVNTCTGQDGSFHYGVRWKLCIHKFFIYVGFSSNLQFWWLLCSGSPVVGDVLLLLLLSVSLFGGRTKSVVDLSPCPVLAGLSDQYPVCWLCALQSPLYESCCTSVSKMMLSCTVSLI